MTIKTKVWQSTAQKKKKTQRFKMKIKFVSDNI